MGKNILQYLFSGYLKLLKKTVAIEWQEIQFVTGNQVFGFWHEDSFLMNLVLEDTIRPIRYRFLGREVKNIRGTGKFRTLKFRCELATSTGESFEDGSEFTIWISDDRNRIPLYVESPIRVGSIRARLISWKNLKYPLDSKIK